MAGGNHVWEQLMKTLNPLHFLIAFADKHLGRCSRCMNSAFLASASASLLALTTIFMSAPRGLQVAAIVLAGALTALWFAHVVASSLRAACVAAGKIALSKEPSRVFHDRRAIFVAAAKTAGLAAVVSVALTLLRSAHAQSNEHECKQKCFRTYNINTNTCSNRYMGNHQSWTECMAEAQQIYNDCITACS